MKYYSEVTKKLYDTENELMEDERKMKESDEEKARREKEVDKAWEEVEQCEKILEEKRKAAAKIAKKFNEDFPKDSKTYYDPFLDILALL